MLGMQNTTDMINLFLSVAILINTEYRNFFTVKESKRGIL